MNLEINFYLKNTNLDFKSLELQTALINVVNTIHENNFYQKISLKEVADLIHLTESNFCKFFKKATGKTYSNYLNELRINEACRMLVQTEKTISQISFDCGFETLSYFNRVFLEKKMMTPSSYKQTILK
jgi:AraC-like DNA-binding protein